MTNVPSVTTYCERVEPVQRVLGHDPDPDPDDLHRARRPGWWKIRYNMTGTGSSATDITTWQVEIRGNPVHLILP